MFMTKFSIRYSRFFSSSTSILGSMASAKVLECKGNRVYCFSNSNPSGVVVFFGGDQVDPEHLQSKCHHLQDPASQAMIMQEKFPGSAVLVVKPDRMEGPFSCYDTFLVKTTRSGEPLGYDGKTFKASSQLQLILQESLGLTLLEQGKPLVVVGFSKGGVVLTQLLYELACSEEHAHSSSLALSALRQLHYLDAGLACRGMYLTDTRIANSLLALKQHPFSVGLHGTPRNWDDPRRPWISSEKSRCFELLRERCTMNKLFEGEPPSLEMHFRVISDFVPVVPPPIAPSIETPSCENSLCQMR